MPAVFVGALIMSIVLLTGCGSSQTPQQSTSAPTLRYGLVVDPSTFDPHLSTSDEIGVVLRQVYDTLIYRDPNTLGFVPGLASNWSVSEDGLTYTFQLKQGVTFHDNTPFNAAAVAANLDRIVDIGANGRAMSLLGPYEGYEIVDDFTISLNLSKPHSAFLDALSQVYLGIASPTAFNTYSLSRYQFHQVGTGPYRFVDFIPGNFVVIERNLAYNWGPLFYDRENDNPVERVRFEFYTGAGSRPEALLAGEVDVIGGLLPSDARSLAVNPQVQILPLTLPGQPYQFIMNTDEYPTDNALVRQALLYGSNRDEVANTVFQGFTSPAWSPLTRTTLFHSSSFNGAYGYNLLEARGLLESAGFADSDNNGIFDIDGVPLEVSVVLLRNDIEPLIVEQLRTQWRDAGVQISLTIAPTRATLANIIEEGTYNLVASRSAGLEPTFLYDYYATTGNLNWTLYSNEALDENLTAAVRENDVAARASRYVSAQTAVINEALVLPIVDAVNLVGTSTDVLRLTFHAERRDPILPNVQYAPGP